MRFTDYNLISELCDSVIEALSYMINTESDELLEDCIGASDVIASTLSANADAIRSDDICPLVERIRGALTSDDLTVGALVEALEDASALKVLCREGLAYRLRVLFVAELGGKWDAMESVYKAFAERNDCDVDVVIEPIFRAVKLPDGSTRTETVYDDFLTPMGIQNIHYTKYDMEHIRPDITFISQPYESVTIPMFYPENIMKYSRLVYLPYFTAMTLNREASSAYDSFFRLNAQKCSWKIACQSETMRQHYKNIASEKGRNVIVSGLPKWDHVYGRSRDNVAVPAEWAAKLDGRTVILWNTHFSTDIGERFQEMLDFIDIFAKDDKLALIWRPHPMSEAVIKVYRPDLYGKYLELKRLVTESANMLIDESSSYLPAFVCSDAIITGFSSLMEQYLLTGKPVLLSTDKTPEQIQEKIASADGLFDYAKLPLAYNLTEKKEFIYKIANGCDEWADDRRMLLDTYFPNADGRCGERLAEALINEFAALVCDNKETVINKVLVVGSEEDSDLCIRQLERLELEYSVCSEYMQREGHTVSLMDINADDYDLFILTARDEIAITELLTCRKDIDHSKILDFWKLYNAGIPIMVCDRIMQNPTNESFDGVVLGISHTEVGIDVTKLKGNFCNLAVSSQDLYAQHKTLEYCLNNYPEKLSRLKYAIIDLYDYHYFNYDNSLSTTAMNYLYYGGYNLDPHHFNSNKNVNVTFEQVIAQLNQRKFGGISKEHIDIWTAVFGTVYELNDFVDFNSAYHDLSGRKRMVTAQDVDSYSYKRGTLNVHQDTITENIGAFEDLLKLLKRINPDIKIYTVLVPKYIETEIRDIPKLSKHKIYFNEIIAEMQQKYGFTHLDFKEISDIAMHKCYYYDAAHLNYFGALELTRQLKDIIFGEK